MTSLLASLEARLAARADADLLRRLEAPAGVDFASNDYLGLGADPAFARRLRDRLAALGAGSDAAAAEHPVAAPASRLLRGHTATHAALEARFAAWKGTEAALLYPSGWQANVGLLTAILRPQDRVLSDALNHASLIDGMRLARCETVVLPHLDLSALETALDEALETPWPGAAAGGHTVVVVESLFGMDGDLAPLEAIAALCRRHDAALVVDDAHATGLYGPRGAGWVAAQGVTGDCLAVVSTCGKALAAAGAFVAGPRRLIDALVNFSRPFVFSTATSPLVCAAIDTALDVVEAEPRRRRRTLRLAARLRAALGLAPANDPGAPIVPVLVGANDAALAVAAAVQADGFDVRAVRPPTVPPGTARLRVSVHADHDEATIDALAASIERALAAAGIERPVGFAR